MRNSIFIDRSISRKFDRNCEWEISTLDFLDVSSFLLIFPKFPRQFQDSAKCSLPRKWTKTGCILDKMALVLMFVGFFKNSNEDRLYKFKDAASIQDSFFCHWFSILANFVSLSEKLCK